MIVPFLFSLTPATPSVETAAPIVISAAPTPPTFAGLLEQISICHHEGTEGSALGEPNVQVPGAARDDNDEMEMTDVSWAAYAMMPVVLPQPVMAAEASPTPVDASASPVVIPATVEQAIATTVEPLGEDAADITVEALITDADASLPKAVPVAVTDSASPIQSDLSLLDPRFRSRVERVITRARTELGMQVVVKETMRTQERQDALFAQGRTVPGEVVTWTKRSLHSTGFAADLAIVSDDATPVIIATSYERLARIANDEGLNTLGPRDPGHVEFRGGPALTPTVFQRRNDLHLVPLGKVAPVEVAPVARPEIVEAPKPAATAPVARVIAPVRHPEQVVVPAALEVQIPRFTRDDNATRDDNPTRDDTPFIPAPTLTLTMPDAPVSEPAIATTNIAARIEQVHAIADIVADRPVTGVVLRLDGDAGNGDRIRIDVRRNVVETSVRAADPTLTQRLIADTPVLRSALERQGLEVGHIEVRSQMVAVADARPRGFEGGREREPSPESNRRSPHHEPRQRQRRNPNQNGESQR